MQRLLGQTDEDQPEVPINWSSVKRTLTNLLVAVVIFAVALFFCFGMFAMVYNEYQDQEHAKEQSKECKEAGGFARTNSAGELIECTFKGPAR